MSFERPALSQLIEQTQSDFEARLPGADARVHNSLINVLARVHAGALHGLYGYLESIRDNAFLIDPDDDYLELMASRWGISREANNYAGGYAFFFATNGVVIPEGYLMQDKNGRNYATIRSGRTYSYDDGEDYQTPQFVTDYKPADWVILPIRALEVGEVDLARGDQLTVMHPVASGGSIAVVYGSFRGGEQIESNDDLKERLFDRMRRPPMGGTVRDYERWALSAHSDITRVWVFPQYQSQRGNVTIFIAADHPDSGRPGVPIAHHFSAVNAVLAEKAPALASINVLSVFVSMFTITVSDYQSSLPDVDAKERMRRTVIDFLIRESAPGGVIKIGRLRDAMSSTPGLISHNLVAPAADIQASEGTVFALGDITWT